MVIDMADSTNMSPEWVKSVLSKYPCTVLESGDIRTCPVRLSFPWVFKKQEAMEEGGKPKYAATLLFPHGADLTVLRKAAEQTVREKWGEGAGKKFTIHSPFRDQKDKAERYDGYTPGAYFITSSSERKPPVVDTKRVPVVDEAKVYPGVWALVIVRPFAYEKKVKRGISFGLQSLMIFHDDVQLGGGAIDPETAFAGVDPIDVSNDLTLEDLMG